LIPALALAAALASPAAAGDRAQAQRLASIDRVIAESIARGELPGAVVLVGRGDAVLWRKAYGNRALEPVAESMTADTIFDVASLTKSVATAPSVLLLVEEGRLRLSDPVVRYLLEFAPDGGDRAKVTVEQLLTHRAGLPADDPIGLYEGARADIFARKYRIPLATAPGAAFVYSDVGYEVLGELVERAAGEPLDRFAKERLFGPLGMKDTTFLPLQAGKPAERIAPAERREGRWMRGEVHDPRAYALGGVAGHAGLFSTADDLARFCRMILGSGRLGAARVLSPLGVEALTRPRFYGDGDVRALGFDVATAYSSNRGDLFPPGSFGHTGFTGTSIWIDPASQSFVVFLSNRVHPDGKGDVVRLRALVASIAAAAMDGDLEEPARNLASKAAPLRPTLAGVDVLAAESFQAIAGKRVGLITNASGRGHDGRSTAAILASPEARRAGVILVRLFAPEHGVRSDADGPVLDGTDAETGVPVVSLYGERLRPRPEDLTGLDAVVFDVQDVGARFYTYLTTLGLALEEAAKARIPFVVLDRPDPTGADVSEGPLSDADAPSFTAYWPVPVRTGMTAGELARLFNDEKRLGADLRVVPVRGWSRTLWYDETGLEWINPSPSIRSLDGAALYPGVALLETTNLSVGRGTDAPFELVGAPWLDGARLARVLSARRIPGATFTPVHFVPSSSTYAGQRCGGVRLAVTDRRRLRPVAVGVEIAVALRDLHPGDWDRSRMNDLLANRKAFDLFRAGADADRIVGSWREDLEAFRRRAVDYFLY